MTKIMSFLLRISGTGPHIIVIFGTCVQNYDISSTFFLVFKILIFRVFQTSSINAKRRFWGVPSHIHIVFYIYLRFFCILIVIILWIIARKYDLGELYFILLWNESVYFCALLKMNRWFLSEMKNKELRNEEEYIQQQQNGVDGDPRK